MCEKYDEIIRFLNNHADEKYRDFSKKLLPGVDNIIGVRLPVLRKLARQISREDWREYLKYAGEQLFEEVMLCGMIIGCAQCGEDERIKYIRQFLPKISNWSVCDSFCSGLKTVRREPEKYLELIKEQASTDKPFQIRFAVVMLLDHYREQKYINQAFDIFFSIKNDNYYVKMAIAWAFSVFYRDFPQITEQYLREDKLDPFTYKKARQKIRELRINSNIE